MTGETFKEEILRYVGEAYDEYTECQKLMLEMFGVFHRICTANGIPYYYGFGSLLGIVRDGGMIPWDADVDVLVPVSRMRELIDCLRRELPEDYYVVSNFTDRKYYLCELRVCRQGYDPDVYHIDVFYLIGAPKQPEALARFDRQVKKVYYRRALRYQPLERGKDARSRLVYYAKKIIRFFLRLRPDVLFDRQCERMLFRYPYEESENCIVWAVGGEIFPVNLFEPARLWKKDDFVCRLPRDPDAFLTIRYGNYGEYLPIRDRFEEFYGYYCRFQKEKTAKRSAETAGSGGKHENKQEPVQ